jgi:outer membrane protein W
MRKTIIITVAALALFTGNGFAQARDTEKDKAALKESNGKVLKEGKVLFNVYYGAPFWWGTFAKNINSTSGGTVITGVGVKNLNHLGAKVEYMVTDKVSLGIDYTYAQVALNYYDSPNGTTLIAYNDLIVKQRALLSCGIHFGESDKFDPYLALGLGYKALTYKTNNPNPNDLKLLIETYASIPIAYRTAFGFRYFFTDNIGINAEVGIGGPIGQIGVCAKF